MPALALAVQWHTPSRTPGRGRADTNKTAAIGGPDSDDSESLPVPVTESPSRSECASSSLAGVDSDVALAVISGSAAGPGLPLAMWPPLPVGLAMAMRKTVGRDTLRLPVEPDLAAVE